MASRNWDVEDFAVVNAWKDAHLFEDFTQLHNAHISDPDTYMQAALRRQYPELNLTVTFPGNVPLLRFAATGEATAELDAKDEGVQRYRAFIAGNPNRSIPDRLYESRTFAKYIYSWSDQYYIVYIITLGYSVYQYILKEPGDGESTVSTNRQTDRLLWTVGQWSNDNKYVYVYDGYWTTSKSLYDEVQKASWKDVILDERMKHTLTDLVHKFFDSRDTYKELGVPWKRGVIFHGPAGNGKTISIKAMMHSVYERSASTIPSLYVKSAPRTYNIGSIFDLARQMSPCLLILEDIDTIVTPASRSYFFNEVDGLQNNDGIFMIASTNHLDQLDPGLSSRPSRFDRKYLFPPPDMHQRVLYCQYWKHKLRENPAIEFPEELCPAIAKITERFTFAYLKEAFVATLVVIAGRRSDREAETTTKRDNLDRYELWREIKRQIALLRDDMDTRNAGGETMLFSGQQNVLPWKADANMVHSRVPLLDAQKPGCAHLSIRPRENQLLGHIPPSLFNNLTIQPPAPDAML